MTDQPRPDEVLLPAEHLPITFFGSPVLAVRRDDGRIYLNIRDLCGAAMIDPSSQMRRIRTHPKLQPGLARFRVPTTGGPQNQDFLALERVATWLLMINAARVSEDVRSRLSYLQDYLVSEVHAAFMRLAGLSPAPGEIEDLADLQRLGSAITALSERQQQIEESQTKARHAWRDISDQLKEIVARVDAIEGHSSASISRAQRGYIYQMVQAWAQAKQQHDPQLSPRAAHATCWGVLKTQFRIARYEDLPASKYPAAIAFIRSAYRQLTGEPLDLPEQTPLDLGTDGG
ncbi:hypothetical protein EKD04_023500 [Chloroflexales bacterium ZM16-3]|nr:hypothetical protein [Chloroflexales bacterium ZM16-3]